MTVTCTGSDFNDFMTDPAIWKDGVYFDDVYCEMDGKRNELEYTFEGDDSPPESALILIGGGELYGLDPKSPRTWFSFEDTLRDWLKARSVVTFVIEVPNGNITAVKRLLEDAGITVVKRTLF